MMTRSRGTWWLAGVLVLLAGCANDTLTMSNYERLSPGMTRAEVEAVLGEGEKCTGAMGFSNCVWGDRKRSIQAQFVANRAITFQYQGLEQTGR
ncbi:hypothetical protein [Larsenimonas rhizosphaerae]|uniref:Lipoprotein SmpA/OmlA domain-containing protein n=1 Tax=Larsenimonas rhizosphaerae TaxID=2944682 RepID=A0AA41ZJJ8_9GAMM|nr:hypothetical protein [Larsenimonas rhizosphaerae]MCX2525138.1 hypothetical protein [Larsenimonas rhizosphaerae]